MTAENGILLAALILLGVGAVLDDIYWSWAGMILLLGGTAWCCWRLWKVYRSRGQA